VNADKSVTCLEEGILFLDLELVGAEELDTAEGLFLGETVVVALEQLEDVVDNDGLQVDFFFVVQILRFELDSVHVYKGLGRAFFFMAKILVLSLPLFGVDILRGLGWGVSLGSGDLLDVAHR
jgi:hypothetical protein